MRQNGCRHTFRVSLFIDGELPEKELDILLSHLKGCEECRGFMEFFSSFRKDLKDAVEGIPFPEEGALWSGILSRIVLHEERKRLSSLPSILSGLIRRPLIIPATLALFTILFITFFTIESLFRDGPFILKEPYQTVIHRAFTGDNSCSIEWVRTESGNISILPGDTDDPTILILFENNI